MQIKTAIKKTIAYAKKYDLYLNENQIWGRLVGPSIFSKKEILRAISKMGIKTGKGRNKETKKKERVGRRLAKMISKNDGDLLLVGLTGSVAAENCKKGDDIDMLIVTRKNRLWKSRLKLKWFLKKNRIPCRAYGVTEGKDDFCFNMWLEEDRLELPREKRTEKSAVDLILMKPLIDKDDIYEKFMKKNRWAKRWVATPYEKRLEIKGEKLKQEKIAETKGKLDGWSHLINCLAFGVQYVFMWPKIEGEKVNKKRVFFHQG